MPEQQATVEVMLSCILGTGLKILLVRDWGIDMIGNLA